MEDLLDENSILVADGGDFVGSAAYILRYVMWSAVAERFSALDLCSDGRVVVLMSLIEQDTLP